MKKSNKVLLYGLLASVLLILLCLYTHQDMFINQKIDKVITQQHTSDIKEDIIQTKTVQEIVPTLKKPEVQETKIVPQNRATLLQPLDENRSETHEENKTRLNDKDLNRTVAKGIFKNKEEIKLKEHPKVETVKNEIADVDKNLPLEDNTPLIDNEKSKQKEEKKKITKENSAVKKPLASSSKKESTKSLLAIQEDINKITTRNISFYKSKSQLTKKSKETLDKVLNILKTIPNAKIVIKGYTDASGKEQINLWISQERAKSVKRYLGKHGIPLKNIKAKGFGESELLYGDKPYSELNRRVEIEIKRK